MTLIVPPVVVTLLTAHTDTLEQIEKLKEPSYKQRVDKFNRLHPHQGEAKDNSEAVAKYSRALKHAQSAIDFRRPPSLDTSQSIVDDEEGSPVHSSIHSSPTRRRSMSMDIPRRNREVTMYNGRIWTYANTHANEARVAWDEHIGNLRSLRDFGEIGDDVEENRATTSLRLFGPGLINADTPGPSANAVTGRNYSLPPRSDSLPIIAAGGTAINNATTVKEHRELQQNYQVEQANENAQAAANRNIVPTIALEGIAIGDDTQYQGEGIVEQTDQTTEAEQAREAKKVREVEQARSVEHARAVQQAREVEHARAVEQVRGAEQAAVGENAETSDNVVTEESGEARNDSDNFSVASSLLSEDWGDAVIMEAQMAVRVSGFKLVDIPPRSQRGKNASAATGANAAAGSKAAVNSNIATGSKVAATSPIVGGCCVACGSPVTASSAYVQQGIVTGGAAPVTEGAAPVDENVSSGGVARARSARSVYYDAREDRDEDESESSVAVANVRKSKGKGKKSDA